MNEQTRERGERPNDPKLSDRGGAAWPLRKGGEGKVEEQRP